MAQNPILQGTTSVEDLPSHLLEDRILNLLASENLAVIATVRRDGSPVATPIRYYSLGLEIFYTSWNASLKSRNLRRDPRVSAAISTPLTGSGATRGAQLFGQARTLEPDDPEVTPYREVIRARASGETLARYLADPVTIITPSRILYTDYWLPRSGFSPKQTWQA